MQLAAEPIDLTGPAAEGLLVEAGYAGAPTEGVLFTRRVRLPTWRQVCYFSGECWRVEEAAGWARPERWSANANRVLPWVAGDDLAAIIREDFTDRVHLGGAKAGGGTALFRLASGEVLALQALAGEESLAWLEIDPEGPLLLRCGTLGTEPVRGDLPLLAWAKADCGAAALQAVWRLVTGDAGAGARVRPRGEKELPAPFQHLGWCSWEQYKHEIDEALLLQAARALEDSPLPVRWLLVDDGHLSHRERRLTSFAPNHKFPRGWQPLLERRDPAGLTWFGLWFNFNGYWQNIHPENELGELNEHFLESPAGGLLPRPTRAAAEAFYGALVERIAAAGFDFVKIDDQAQNLERYRGTANAARAAVNNSRALERATAGRGLPLLNCMAHNHACALNWSASTVTRCSIDYKLGDAFKARHHLFQSYHNTLWLGPVVWPDHDMFHSSDPVCGRVMAVSKALSGAPVYLSDAPEDLRPERVRPLCLADGRLLRPLAPAVPLPDCEFVDPVREAVPYRVVAPLAQASVAVCVYNLVHTEEGETTLRAEVSAADYDHAAVLMQPPPADWRRPDEGLAWYDWDEGRGGRLEEALSFRLTGLADKLILLAPIREGWAVIGRPDKYLCAAALAGVKTAAASLEVELVEGGPVVLWSEQEPRCAEAPVTSLGGGLWRVEAPEGSGPATLCCRRG